MSDFQTCPGCDGRLQIRGLGMIFTECPTCNGVGYVEKPKIKSEVITSDGEKVVVTHRRKRRTQAEMQRAKVA